MHEEGRDVSAQRPDHAFSAQTHTENAFVESWRIQDAASKLGFDWPDIAGVLDKVEEEVREIREALDERDCAHAQRELGDLLLATVNLARFLDADPGVELHRANRRFTARFDAVKKVIAEQGKTVGECTLDELDAVWNRVKHGADRALEEGA
jgi:uncharacterized protein YabN with tetrapyrrole methylase and pyrophosphatase domain